MGGCATECSIRRRTRSKRSPTLRHWTATRPMRTAASHSATTWARAPPPSRCSYEAARLGGGSTSIRPGRPAGPGSGSTTPPGTPAQQCSASEPPDSARTSTSPRPPPTANRPRSAWFRQQFTITDASALSQVAVTTRADDGVVVYVNGIEIGRKKLPTGTLASTSYATAAPRTSIATATANAVTFTVPTTALRDGPNVITASTHLNYRSTADLSFDLVMTGMLDGDPPPPDEPPTAPVVTASTTGDTATLGLTHAAGVAGYRISRDGAELSTVPAPGTTFTDSGLAPSTTYRYSVIVVGTTGLTSPAGTASITTAATPPPPPPGPTTLVQTGSTWRWQYVNTAWPAGWTGLGFDDFTWNTGPAVLGLRQRRPPHQRRNGQRRNLHRPHHSIARQNQRRHRINPPQRPRHHRHQLRPCHDRHTEGIGIRRVGRGAPRPGLLGARWTGAAEAAVPVVGLEPTRPLEQSILSAPRLPFRHTGAQQPRSEYRRV